MPIIRVDIIERLRGFWTSSQSWGSRLQGEYPRTEGHEVAVLNNDNIPGRPRVQTIHLIRSDRQLTTTANSDVYAAISYGVGALRNTFLMDWISGTQISLAASAISVKAHGYRPNTLQPYVANEGVLLGAMIAEGNVAPCRPPTFTTATINMLSGATFDVPLPDFAKGFQLMAIDPGTYVTTFHVIFQSVQGNAVGRVDGAFFAATGGGLLQGVVIPGGTNHVRLANNTGADVIVYGIFELGL